MNPIWHAPRKGDRGRAREKQVVKVKWVSCSVSLSSFVSHFFEWSFGKWLKSSRRLMGGHQRPLWVYIKPVQNEWVSAVMTTNVGKDGSSLPVKKLFFRLVVLTGGLKNGTECDFSLLDSSEGMRSVLHKWKNLIRAVVANPVSVGMSFITGPPPAFFTMDDVSDSPASHNHTLHGFFFFFFFFFP